MAPIRRVVDEGSPEWPLGSGCGSDPPEMPMQGEAIILAIVVAGLIFILVKTIMGR